MLYSQGAYLFFLPVLCMYVLYKGWIGDLGEDAWRYTISRNYWLTCMIKAASQPRIDPAAFFSLDAASASQLISKPCLYKGEERIP